MAGSTMTMPLVLGVDRFAAWARTTGVRLPDPLDVSAVDGADAQLPVDERALAHLSAVVAQARAAVFLVELLPGQGERVSVALAADRTAVAVTLGGQQVRVAAVRPDELVRTLADQLPELRGLPQQRLEVPEHTWNDLLEQVATDPSPRSAAAALHRCGFGDEAAEAMLAAKQHPVPIGLLGASAARVPGDALQRGPTLASWFAYPAGAVLATLLAPRRGGARTVHVEPYTTTAAARALAEALPAAHRAAERA